MRNNSSEGSTLPEKANIQKLSKLQKYLYLFGKASIPWHLCVGAILLIPGISAKMLVSELEQNYEASGKTISTIQPSGLKEIISYECGDPETILRYVCRKVGELVKVHDEKIDVSYGISESITSEIRKILQNFPQKGHVDILHSEGLQKIQNQDFSGIDADQMRMTQGASQTRAREIALELEAKIPKLKNKIGAEGIQLYLTENEVQLYQKLLAGSGYQGPLNLENIEEFLLSTLINADLKKAGDIFSPEIRKLSNTFHGKTQIHMYGEKSLGTFKYIDSIRAEIIIFLLGVVVFGIYAGTILPISGMKQLKNEMIQKEYEKVLSGKVTPNEKKEFDTIRSVLGFQTFDEFVIFYNSIYEMVYGKVIIGKMNKSIVMFGKDTTGKWKRVEKKSEKYIFRPQNYEETMVVAYSLQDFGFQSNNMEIIDVVF